MTREQYRQRRLFRLSILLVAAVMALAFAAIAYACKPIEEKEYAPVNPSAVPIEEVKAEIAVRTDHPNRFYYRQEIPLDKYLQETLYHAAWEWGVPYELAVAVCWRETEFQNLVTELPSGTYYGMMAVDIEDAGYYMELCGVDNLDTEENRLRVGCCILGQHIKNEGSVRAALCRYSNDYEGWYADSVLKKMGEFL